MNFNGKYCLISVQTPESNAIKQTESYKKYQSLISERSRYLVDFNLGNLHGICMPSTCKMREVVPVINKLFESYNLSILPSKKCTTASEPESLTNLQLISL